LSYGGLVEGVAPPCSPAKVSAGEGPDSFYRVVVGVYCHFEDYGVIGSV
jgi:hypothetical protein